MPRTDRQLDTEPPDRSDERQRARGRGRRSAEEPQEGVERQDEGPKEA